MQNFEKVKTKQELYEMLNQYKFILNKPMLDYLKSLIELEISVVKRYAEEEDKMALLSDLEVFQKIAIYNIYNRALNILRQEKSKLQITGNRQGGEYLRAKFGKETIFDYDYNCRIYEDGQYLRTTSCIHLYETIYAPEMREQELNKSRKQLEEWQNEKSPYNAPVFEKSDLELIFASDLPDEVFGGPDSEWEFEQSDKIREQKLRIAKINAKSNLTDLEKKEIELTGRIHKLMLDDFGLSEESLTPETEEPMNDIWKECYKLIGKEIDDTPKIKEMELPNGIKRVYIKKMSGLEITSTKKYIF